MRSLIARLRALESRTTAPRQLTEAQRWEIRERLYVKLCGEEPKPLSFTLPELTPEHAAEVAIIRARVLESIKRKIDA